MSEVPEVSKVNNEIRVGNRTKPTDILSQSEKLLKDDKIKEIRLTAVGSSIGDLIIAVELLKLSNPALSQQTIFSTIGPRSPKSKEKEKDKEKEKEEKPQKLYPHLEVVLSLGKIEPKEAPKISEEERKTLVETLDKQKEAFVKQRRFNAFRRRRNYRQRFNRRRRFASFARRNVNRYNNRNANGRNWSFNVNRRRMRPGGYNNRNNRRMFQKGPRRFNKANNPVNPASRNQSVNREQVKN